MLAQLRKRLEMAVRVRDFFRAHQTDGATEQGVVARLEQLVQRAEELASQQRAGVVARRGSAEQRVEVRRKLQTKMLRYLSAVGAVAARENTELGAQFRIEHPRGSNQAFVTMVRGMIDKATTQKELLVSRGLSASLLDDLTATLAQFEQTLEATRAARSEHVGASADLKAVISEVSQQVRVLDGLVRYRFGDDEEVMGAWASAHNVVSSSRPQKKPEAGDSTPKAA
jgi:high-affinity Fe2+/Pb2+ permease